MRGAIVLVLTLLPLSFQACTPESDRTAGEDFLAGQEDQSPGHAWEYIKYPTLPPSPTGDQVPWLMLRNRGDQGLQFSLAYFVSFTGTGRRQGSPQEEEITVRLHSADGEIIEPKFDMSADIDATQVFFEYTFPWRANVLEEAWLEVRLPEQTYWVEIPYGYTRDPNASFTPEAERHGGPKFAPTMELQESDLLVAWLSVHYDLGEIQNGWRLFVAMENPFDARAEIELYRDDSEIGKSSFLWELHSPRTAIEIKQPNDDPLHSMGMSIYLHEDVMRRSDGFKFNRNPGPEDRCWGTIVITVGEERHEQIVPSSLFKYVHGVTDPYHKALVPRRRGRW